jgi:hypothetical protein
MAETTAANQAVGRLRKRPEPLNADSRMTDALAFMEGKSEGPSLTPTKGRGRPKGWKPGMSYAEMRGKDPKRKHAHRDPNGGEPKRRGRPAKGPTLTPRENYLRSNPKYIPFLCEWRDTPDQEGHCPAELQNMDTLRKHVYVVHGDAEPLVCRWAKCGTKPSLPEFRDEKGFEEHVESEHFRSFVWHMGDGHQNKGIKLLRDAQDSNRLPAYLYKDDIQVTPSVRDQKFEDELTRRERRRKLKRLLIQKDENAPDEELYLAQLLGQAPGQIQVDG